jgi:hypothetical protein
MRQILPGEEGAALVTALMLTMLTLVIALTMLYAVTAGTRISASQKRYRSALAAAHGGVELVTREIIPKLLQKDRSETELLGDFGAIKLNFPSSACLQQKLERGTASWSSDCAAAATSDPAYAPDFTFTLGGERPSDPGYSVAMKIVDNVPGNTDLAASELLDTGASVAGSQEEVIHPRHIPGMFSIAVQGVGEAPREKARLSVLYAY